MLAAFCLLAMLSFIFAAAPTAQAAASPKVVISGMVRSDSNGNESNEQAVHVGNLVKISFDWDARGIDLSEGDSFSIALPEAFETYEHPHSRALTVPHLDGGVKIGECHVEISDLTCTFDSKAEQLREAGYSDFSGSGTLLVRAVAESEAPEATFTTGAGSVSVGIPGGRIAPSPGLTHTPSEFSAWSAPVTKSSSTIGWSTVFGSDAVAGKLADSGERLALDGKTRSTIVVTQTVSAGQAFSTDLSKWALAMRTNAESSQETTLTLADGTDRDASTYGDFDMNVEIDGDTATITASGPFAADTNYRVSFPTRVESASGTVKPGYVYAITTAIDGTDLQAKASRRYTESVEVTAGTETDYGSFAVYTLLRGNAASTISEDVVFPVDVEYSLPSGTTADSYRDWTAPGTLDPDKTGGTAQLEASAGAVTAFDGTFPAGTVIKLDEDLPAAPAGVKWGRPVLTVGTETVDSFVIRNGTVKVNITNEASAPTKARSSASAQSDKEVALDAGASSPADPAVEPAAGQAAATTKAAASGLARTGISIEALSFAAVVLLMAGVYLAARRRGHA